MPKSLKALLCNAFIVKKNVVNILDTPLIPQPLLPQEKGLGDEGLGVRALVCQIFWA